MGPIPCTSNTKRRLRSFFAQFSDEEMSDERLNAILKAFKGTKEEMYDQLMTSASSPRGSCALRRKCGPT